MPLPFTTPLRRLLRYLCTGLAILLFLVCGTPLVPFVAGSLAGPWQEAGAENLVILGGSLQTAGPDPVLGQSSYLRCVLAIHLWRSGQFRRIVLSGAEVSLAMRRFLIASGVPAEAIVVEDRSRSTRENCQMLVPVLATLPGRGVLLTSDYHMFRAERLCRQAGLALSPRPAPDVIKLSSQPLWRWQGFLLLLEEFAKIAYYKWQGWI